MGVETKPFVSVTCEGEHCHCGQPAVRKVGEEIPIDDPQPHRHNFTAYVCARHYAELMGPGAAKDVGYTRTTEDAVERVASWQPIETAPKDGTRIIVGWLKHGEVRGVSAAKWASAEFWADMECGDPEDFEAGWYEPNYEDELCANVWMPMPAITALEGGSRP